MKPREEQHAGAGYIAERRGKMRYGEYLARGLPIGSGRAEAACKTVVGRRMKCTGMRCPWPARTPCSGSGART